MRRWELESLTTFNLELLVMVEFEEENVVAVVVVSLLSGGPIVGNSQGREKVRCLYAKRPALQVPLLSIIVTSDDSESCRCPVRFCNCTNLV